MKIVLVNHTHPLPQQMNLEMCATFASKLLGLMFKKDIAPFSGILLLDIKDGMLSSAIHMLFMRFDICVVWADRSGRVVDIQLARRWHLLYKPKKPACMTIELHPSHMQDFKLGDKLSYAQQ